MSLPVSNFLLIHSSSSRPMVFHSRCNGCVLQMMKERLLDLAVWWEKREEGQREASKRQLRNQSASSQSNPLSCNENNHQGSAAGPNRGSESSQPVVLTASADTAFRGPLEGGEASQKQWCLELVQSVVAISSAFSVRLRNEMDKVGVVCVQRHGAL